MALNLNEIQIGGGSKYPKKTSINLLRVESHVKENLFSIVVLLIFMTAVLFAVKHFVIGGYAEVDRMESYYNSEQSILDAMKDKNAEYSEVRAQYSHYGNGYLNEDEAAEQDRIKILDVVEQKLLSEGALENISITGNTATLTINNRKLGNVSDISAALEENDIVKYVTVTNSETDQQDTGIAVANEDATQKKTTVTTIMTIIFKDANEDEKAAAAAAAANQAETTSADGTGGES